MQTHGSGRSSFKVSRYVRSTVPYYLGDPRTRPKDGCIYACPVYNTAPDLVIVMTAIQPGYEDNS